MIYHCKNHVMAGTVYSYTVFHANAEGYWWYGVWIIPSDEAVTRRIGLVLRRYPVFYEV